MGSKAFRRMGIGTVTVGADSDTGKVRHGAARADDAARALGRRGLRRNGAALAVAIAATCLLWSPASASADSTWTYSSGGNRSTAGNWNNGVPSGMVYFGAVNDSYNISFTVAVIVTQ